MIRNFRHRGLKRLFERDDRSRVDARDVDKIGRILARLDEVATVEDMDLPGFRLHPLKGNLRDFWSVSVRANWRIIFRFEEGTAFDVDLVDTH